MTNLITRSRIGALFLTSFIACGDPAHPTVQIAVDPTTIAQGASTNLTVTVTDFELVNPSTNHDESDEHNDDHDDEHAADPNRGHYHVYLDSTEQNPITMAYQNQLALQIPVETNTGTHTIIVRLNHENHMTIVPHVEDSVEITVTGP